MENLHQNLEELSSEDLLHEIQAQQMSDEEEAYNLIFQAALEQEIAENQ